MIDVLKILLLAAHLLAMDLASAGPIAALFFLPGKGDRHLSGNRVARRIAWQSLAALGVGILFGAALWLLADEPYLAALQRFATQAYWYAAAELLFSAICIALMAFAICRWPKRRWLAALLAALSLANLWYHFPPFMTVLGKLASDPHWSPLAVIPRKELLRLMASRDVMALSLHFALASLTTASVFAIWSTAADSAADENDANLAPARRKAAWTALLATAAQLGVGVWILAAMEGPARDALLGGNLWGTASFAAAVFGTLMLLERLAAVALGDNDLAACKRVGVLLIAVVVLMCATLYVVRQERKPLAKNARATVPAQRAPAHKVPPHKTTAATD